MKPIELRDKCTALLDRLGDRLPHDQRDQLRRFNSVGEWPELASNLAAILVRRKIPVSAAEQEALREILYAFNPPVSGYPELNNPDEVLASLTLAEPAPE
jgi:hypothetical protein